MPRQVAEIQVEASSFPPSVKLPGSSKTICTFMTIVGPLTGVLYTEEAMENCIVYWISIGKYSDTEAATVEEFLEAFRDGTFSPGASILLAQSPDGSTTIGFTKDGESDYYEQATFGRSLGVHHWVERRVVCSLARLSHEVAGTDGGCENGKVVEGEKGETNGINGKAGKTEPVVFPLKWESVKVV